MKSLAIIRPSAKLGAMLKRSSFIAIVVLSAAARADIYIHSEDGLVIERSEIIVIAHIKADSFKGGSDPKYPESQARATLVIEQVLKGSIVKREIEITVYDYLNCSVGGKDPFSNIPHNHYLRAGKFRPAAGVINLHHRCNDALLTPHLEAGKIWLLQRHSGELGADTGKGGFGLMEFEEVQELELKDYYQCYLSAEPEASVRAYVATRPQLLARARPFLEHKTVQRISKLPDVNERARRLTPYVVAAQEWKTDDSEARAALAACGDAGGALLEPIFKDPALEGHRVEIMETWGAARYKPAVDLLIELLKKYEAYWVAQDSGIQSFERYDILSETEAAVRVLGNMGDPRALEAVELVAKRWGGNAGSISKACKACEDALMQLVVKEHKDK